MHFDFKNRLFFILRSTLKHIIIDYLGGSDLLVLSSSPLYHPILSNCVILLFHYFWTWIWIYSIIYFIRFLYVLVYYVLLLFKFIFRVLARFICHILSIFLDMLDWILDLLYGWDYYRSDILIINKALYNRLIFNFNF